MDDPYATLGVPANATDEAIQHAYRSRVQKVHPDKGGTAEEFNHVQAAYDLLADRARRARYDSTKQTDPIQEAMQAARMIVAKMVVETMIRLPNVERVDLMAIMSTSVRAEIRKLELGVRDAQALVGRCNYARKHFVHKGAAIDNIIDHVLDAQVTKATEQLAKIADDIVAYERVLQVLAEYAYQTEAKFEWPGGVMIQGDGLAQELMRGDDLPNAQGGQTQ